MISEEKVLADTEADPTVKEKLSTSVSSNCDEVKSDGVLDELAARVDALNYNEEDDFITHTEEPSSTIKRQSDVIKKQAETINTLIQQLRVMFDEYTAESQEKEYYEDLSEALLGYIKVCYGKVIIGDEETESQEGEENIVNLVAKENADISVIDGASPPNPTPEKSPQGACAASTEDEENKMEEAEEGQEEDSEAKETITSKELIRLNHILLREIIELRNERDILRSNAMMSEGDDDDSDFDTDGHSCEHCASTEDMQRASQEEEEYEHQDVDDMQKIENETDTE